MNQHIFNLIQNPLSISSQDLFKIDDEIEQYPYFQTLHLLRAKAIGSSDEKTYKEVVQKTATYCAQRVILYEYLNLDLPAEELNVGKSDEASPELDKKEENLQELIREKQDEDIQQQSTNFDSKESEVGQLLKSHEKSQIEETPSNLQTEDQATSDEESVDTEKVENKTTPLSNQSFNKWLQSNHAQKNQNLESEIEAEEKEQDSVNEKFKVIEEFLDKNPKITPAKEYKSQVDIQPNNKENLSHLMTETLANIYVEQHKYDKAIKAYTILRLKYPEKSGYFADQIKRIQELKHK